MPEYKPIKFSFAVLESEEIQKYSFFLAGCRLKQIVFREVYNPDGSFYVGHLTDRRLIIEPLKFPGWVTTLGNLISSQITGQIDSPGLEAVIKGMTKETKEFYERGKFLSDLKLYWSIPYSKINSFESQKVDWISNACIRVITEASEDRDAFLFKSAEATSLALKGLGFELGVHSNKAFRDLGNDLVNRYKELKNIEIQKKAEEARKAEENKKNQKEIEFYLEDRYWKKVLKGIGFIFLDLLIW